MFVLLVTVSYLSLQLRCVDVGFGDEGFYLSSAFGWSSGNPLSAPWGMLYSVWYRVLSIFCSDRIQLFLLNIVAVNTLLVAAGYVFLRSWGASRLLTVFFSLLVLISSIPSTWPRVGAFGMSCILIGASIAARQKSIHSFMTALAAGCLVAAYARPEFYVSFLGALAMAWIIAWRRKPAGPKDAKAVFSAPAKLTGIAVILFITLGNPLGSSGVADRRLMAFSQHYSMNRVSEAGETRNGWVEYEEIVRERFGAVQSLPMAFKNNPGEFLWHVSVNARKLFKSWFKPALFDSKGVVDVLVEKAVQRLELAGFVVFGAILVVRVLRKGALLRPWFHRWSIMAFVWCLAVMPSALLIQPREHYVHPLIWLTLALVLAAGREVGNSGRGKWLLWVSMLLAGIAILLATRRPVFPKPNTELVRWLDSQSWNHGRTMLDAEGGIAFLSKWPARVVSAHDRFRGETIESFIDRKKIDVIFMTENLMSDPRFEKDLRFKELLANPQLLGFHYVSYLGWEKAFLVRTAVSTPDLSR